MSAPWFDVLPALQGRDVRRQLLDEERQRHAVDVPALWRQRRVDVRVRVDPQNGYFRLHTRMPEDGADGHTVVPAYRHTRATRAQTFLDLVGNLV